MSAQPRPCVSRHHAARNPKEPLPCHRSDGVSKIVLSEMVFKADGVHHGRTCYQAHPCPVAPPQQRTQRAQGPWWREPAVYAALGIALGVVVGMAMSRAGSRRSV